MDNSAAPTTGQKKGIKKLWLKVKASMKTEQDKSSKRTSVAVAATPKATTSTPAPPVTTQTPIEPVSTPVQETSNAQPEPKEIVQASKPTAQTIMAFEIIEVDDEDADEDDNGEKFQISTIRTMSTMPSDKEATALRYTRAQEVFNKYNLDLDPADWQQPDNSGAQRVEKKARMRVRYSCDQCNQAFGREKKCSKCTHMRCDLCVRYPLKKTGGKMKKTTIVVQADPSTLTTPTTGACHECKTTFDMGATECETCNHQICSTCLKETVMSSPATAPPPTQPVAIAASA